MLYLPLPRRLRWRRRVDAAVAVFLVRGRSCLPPPKPPTRGSSSEPLPPPPFHCESGGVGGNSVPKAQRRGAQREGRRRRRRGGRTEKLRRRDAEDHRSWTSVLRWELRSFWVCPSAESQQKGRPPARLRRPWVHA